MTIIVRCSGATIRGETMLPWETDPSLRDRARGRGGPPFLPPVTERVPLELIDTRTFGSRVIFERYRRARR